MSWRWYASSRRLTDEMSSSSRWLGPRGVLSRSLSEDSLRSVVGGFWAVAAALPSSGLRVRSDRPAPASVARKGFSSCPDVDGLHRTISPVDRSSSRGVCCLKIRWRGSWGTISLPRSRRLSLASNLTLIVLAGTCGFWFRSREILSLGRRSCACICRTLDFS